MQFQRLQDSYENKTNMGGAFWYAGLELIAWNCPNEFTRPTKELKSLHRAKKFSVNLKADYFGSLILGTFSKQDDNATTAAKTIWFK